VNTADLPPQTADAVRDVKAQLRRQILSAREAVPSEDLAVAAAAITERLVGLEAVRSASVAAVFVSRSDELDTLPLIESLRARGCVVLLPVLARDNSLTWREYAGSDSLVAGRFGLLEPAAGVSREAALAEAGVVVVPGVCYDAQGHRLGRGGGSYDRALRALSRQVPRVGMALDSEIVERVPVAAHDEGVDIVVTPTRIVTAAG
jgi:5-formyltetrahydrofolate cyclo-ligase